MNSHTRTQAQSNRVHHYFSSDRKSWHSVDSKTFKWITYRRIGLHLAYSAHRSSESCHALICTSQWKNITSIWKWLKNMARLENLGQNKYLTRYFKRKTYMQRKRRLPSTLEASALKLGVTFLKLGYRIEWKTIPRTFLGVPVRSRLPSSCLVRSASRRLPVTSLSRLMFHPTSIV
jgi:hypothetical protein